MLLVKKLIVRGKPYLGFLFKRYGFSRLVGRLIPSSKIKSGIGHTVFVRSHRSRHQMTGYRLTRRALLRMSFPHVAVNTYSRNMLVWRAAALAVFFIGGYFIAAMQYRSVSIAAMELRVDQSRDDADQYLSEAIRLQKKLDVQQIELAQLHRQLDKLHADRINLHNDLVFYKNLAGKKTELARKKADAEATLAAAQSSSLASSAAKPAPALQETNPVVLKSFVVNRAAESGEYAFSILLAKDSSQDNAIKGVLKLTLVGVEVDKVVTVPFDEPRPFVVDFKKSQRINGEFQIPEYWTNRKIRVSLLEDGNSKPSYSWVTKVPE